MKRICFFTGTRAEYGLLKPLISKFENDSDYHTQILATGMHLCNSFGMTVNNIKEDGFSNLDTIEILLNSDTPIGLSKSIGLGLISFSEYLEKNKPNYFVVLGDRFEALSGALAAYLQKIPIIHLHGGETTEGLIDEGIRHSISKLSSIHFTSTETYRKRVIQLGESPSRVFNFGAIGIDNIKNELLMSKEELEKSINFKFKKSNYLITYHPVTLEQSSSKEQITQILNALDTLENVGLIFTKANADTDGDIINREIDKYVANNKDKSVCITSLGMKRYLSCISLVDGVIGNSSSGLIEVPSFNKGTINIGDRQRGRISGDTVIHCNPEEESIINAIKKLNSSDFKEKIRKAKNPYGEGNVSTRIYNTILSLGEMDLKKKFYDLKDVM